MPEVSMRAIDGNGKTLCTTYGTALTLAAAKREAWTGMAARLGSDVSLEKALRDIKTTVL